MTIEGDDCISKDNLIEISLNLMNNNNRHIQAIYRNCPNLKYFNLPLNSNDFSGLVQLLIHCQQLNGLVVVIDDYQDDHLGMIILVLIGIVYLKYWQIHHQLVCICLNLILFLLYFLPSFYFLILFLIFVLIFNLDFLSFNFYF